MVSSIKNCYMVYMYITFSSFHVIACESIIIQVRSFSHQRAQLACDSVTHYPASMQRQNTWKRIRDVVYERVREIVLGY